jgi:hypothetical protein
MSKDEAMGTGPSPLPATLLQMMTGYWVSQALHVAAKLGIADLLAGGPVDCEDLPAATDTHAPSLQRLLRALASVGVFTEVSHLPLPLQQPAVLPVAELASGSERGAATRGGARARLSGLLCRVDGGARGARDNEPSLDGQRCDHYLCGEDRSGQPPRCRSPGRGHGGGRRSAIGHIIARRDNARDGVHVMSARGALFSQPPSSGVPQIQTVSVA